MLEVQKKVLSGVSFSRSLFRKELKKSQVWLQAEEFEELKTWVKSNFMHMHPEVINDVFNQEFINLVE